MTVAEVTNMIDAFSLAFMAVALIYLTHSTNKRLEAVSIAVAHIAQRIDTGGRSEGQRGNQ